ncbi:MAG: hypothetical protein OEV92_13465, partial [Nitrospinota bacterium]|nr:hypothetical protein [Nitrospinota bacterium]
MLKGTSLKFKLLTGLLTISILVVAAGRIGIWGADKIGNNLKMIAEEKAPVTDASMEMIVTLTETLYNIERYKSVTNVLGSANASKTDGLIREYKEMVERYDLITDKIMKGGKLGSINMVASTNEALRSKVTEADQLHNNKLQPLITEIHNNGLKLINNDEIRHKAMKNMENAYDEIVKLAFEFEDTLKKNIDIKRRRGMQDEILDQDIRWADMSMEIR